MSTNKNKKLNVFVILIGGTSPLELERSQPLEIVQQQLVRSDEDTCEKLHLGRE